MSDIQTLSNTQSQVTYAGNAVTLAFPTTFAFLEDNHLVVELSADAGVTWTPQTLDDAYTVDGAGEEEPGGTVTMAAAPAVGVQLRITRDTPITQETELQTSGPLPAKAIITALVKLTMVAQERDRRLAAVEALGDLVDITNSNSTHFTHDFTTDVDAVEETFPFDVVVAGGSAAIGGDFQVRSKADPTHRFDTSPTVQWLPGAGNAITITGIDGLDPGVDYRMEGLVFR